jgi:hypothetical protein
VNENSYNLWPRTKNPESEFERRVARLAKDALPADALMRVDAVLSHALFGTLSEKKTRGLMVPANSRGVTVERNVAVEVRHWFHTLVISGNENDCIDDRVAAFVEKIRCVKDTGWDLDDHDVQQSLLQYVRKRRGDELVLTDMRLSLATRYYLIHEPASNIKLQRVSFAGMEGAQLGLRATKPICKNVHLLRTCTNLAMDAPFNFDDDAEEARLPEALKLSVCTPASNMRGPAASRLALGALRFVNHSCKANAEVIPPASWNLCRADLCLNQLKPIRDTHAVVLLATKDILPGESITIRYQDTWDQYMPGHHCLCDTCSPSLKSPEWTTGVPPGDSGPSRKRKRGGVRHKKSLAEENGARQDMK